MSKVEQAQQVLRELGLPEAQQNERSALVLLALARVERQSVWTGAGQHLMRLVEIMEFIREEYGKDYKPNSREDLRKNVIRQFEHARIVDANPDQPKRPTNSPNYAYQLTSRAVDILQAFGTSNYEARVAKFRADHGALVEEYWQARELLKVPVTLLDGSDIRLSPGDHNDLQKAIIEVMGPRFAHGANLLYLGDTRDKHVVYESKVLEELGVPITQHDKLPDVVLHVPEKNWLYLIEAVTSTGPVDPKRHSDLEAMLSGCTADRVYVTAFPDVKLFRKFAADIAWETEVWIASQPDHMIHFNGPKFLGPYKKADPE